MNNDHAPLRDPKNDTFRLDSVVSDQERRDNTLEDAEIKVE